MTAETGTRCDAAKGFCLKPAVSTTFDSLFNRPPTSISLAFRPSSDSGERVSSNPQEPQIRAWVAAWRESAAALEQIKTEELRALTTEEAACGFADMAVDTDTLWISPERANATGLIEQQRLFMLSHEHPARHRRRP